MFGLDWILTLQACGLAAAAPTQRETRKQRHARRVAAREAFRTALGLHAIGADIDNDAALFRIGMEALNAKQAQTGQTLGLVSIDHAHVAIEKASGRSLPRRGGIMEKIQAVWTGGAKIHREREEAARKADETPDEIDLYGMAQVHPQHADLYRSQMLRLANRARDTLSQKFPPLKGAVGNWVSVVVTLNGLSDLRVYPARKGQKASISVTLALSAAPYWHAGMEGHFGPRTLILGQSGDRKTVKVLRVRAKQTYYTTQEPAPALPGNR
jgi:hypothetical protein